MWLRQLKRNLKEIEKQEKESKIKVRKIKGSKASLNLGRQRKGYKRV